MATCIHLPTNARCTVVSAFKDGEDTFYTLREIVESGNFSRSFTARESAIRFEQVAQVIKMEDVRAAKKESAAPSKPEPSILSPKENDGKLRINDPGLTSQTLASSIIQGIGPVTAGRILELRDAMPNKRFSSLDELRSIRGINWKAYAEQISFD